MVVRMASPLASDFAPGDRLGPYSIEAPIGEGGMGKVFRAAGPDGSVVALKVLKGALAHDAAHARRFAREARAAREIDHRHLVGVLDAGEAGGRSYLAMRYVAGRSLADRIRSDGALPVAEAIRIVAEVASGLDALHRAGMVHRDVKPSNILLDEDRGAVLTDFGLAKRRDYSALTRPGQLLGTLDYIAPEQLRGDEPGAAADVYALGGVTFECLAGRPPFAGRSTFALGMAHLEDEPPDPCADRDDAPRELGGVVRQALAKDPAQRPATATAFARMLIVTARSD
jgi:serine/threonine protein kinase